MVVSDDLSAIPYITSVPPNAPLPVDYKLNSELPTIILQRLRPSTTLALRHMNLCTSMPLQKAWQQQNIFIQMLPSLWTSQASVIKIYRDQLKPLVLKQRRLSMSQVMPITVIIARNRQSLPRTAWSNYFWNSANFQINIPTSTTIWRMTLALLTNDFSTAAKVLWMDTLKQSTSG